MWKVVVAIMMLFALCASPCIAGGCADTQSAAAGAMRQRNDRVRDTINTAIPDPEEGRDVLASCLETVSSLGDAFSMGVSLPSMDTIIDGMCRQATSLMQQKVDEVMHEARSTVAQIGADNPFRVTGSGKDIAGAISAKIK